jgi:hypothetical protein
MAGNVTAALDLVAAAQFDLVLLDSLDKCVTSPPKSTAPKKRG